jgi:hypothetical protein
MPRALIGPHSVFCHAVHVVCNGVTKVEDKFFLIGQDKLGKKKEKKLLYFLK